MPTPGRSSPVLGLNVATDLDFGEAMQDVARGCAVARREWGDGCRVVLQAGVLHIQIDEDRPNPNEPEKTIVKGVHKFLVSDGDITAGDWIVVRKV